MFASGKILIPKCFKNFNDFYVFIYVIEVGSVMHTYVLNTLSAFATEPHVFMRKVFNEHLFCENFHVC